ncbi:MAG: COQ9 family protein [Alphaproteobacteria bacterium]|nr:COQ9 family protein [Alphaproteobacteria bacterium]|tara:strand:- start:822 stop:1436 length:615 start_codon:yes stop_codon:yes gene_type:complete
MGGVSYKDIMDYKKLKSDIIKALLENVAFDGLTWNVVKETVAIEGHSPDMADALFPARMKTVAADISAYFDSMMMDQLENVDPEKYRIRERIRIAVEKRLEVMAPYKESLLHLTRFWVRGRGGLSASRSVWLTSDMIWNWAGDTSQDYNHYTKRMLLSGVIISTFVYWFRDDTSDLTKTFEFLDRRIDNVLKFGQFIGRFKKAS